MPQPTVHAQTALFEMVLSRRQRWLWQRLAGSLPVSDLQAKVLARTHARLSSIPLMMCLMLAGVALPCPPRAALVLAAGAAGAGVFAVMTLLLAGWFWRVKVRLSGHVA